MSKKYAEFEKMVADYAARKEKTLEQLDKELEANKKIIMESNEKMRNAVDSSDGKAYKAAAADYDAAVHMNDYIKQRRELEVRGTQEEAEKAEELKKQIRTKCAADANEYVANITKLLDEVAALNKSFAEDCEAAGSIVMTWHRKVRPYKKQVGMRGTEPYCVDELPDIGVDVSSVNRFTSEVNEFREELNRLVY